MNRVTLKGNLGADPEVRTTASGDPVVSASLATNKTYRDKAGNKQEKTQWHRLTIWGARGEAFARFHSKGSEALVEGEIEYSSYEDKDGVTKYSTDIIVKDWHFVGGERDGESAPAAPAKSAAKSKAGKPKKAASVTTEEEDDLPF